MRPSSSTPASVAPTEPHAAGEQRAADHHRGDGEQLPADALDRLAGAELRREDDAGEPGQAAAQHVDEELHPVDRQAHQPRRVLVAADRQHVVRPKAVKLSSERAEQIGDERDPGRHGKAEEVALPEGR